MYRRRHPHRPGTARRWSRITGAFVMCALLLSAAGCGDNAEGSSGGLGTVTVAAGASLTAAFQEIGAEFEKTNPGAKVQLNFAGSATLVAQLINGAPVDVFASADEATMKRATDASVIDGGPKVFARNRLEIAVAPGNPKNITGLADLNRPGLVISMCAPQVPVGQYARQAYTNAGLPFPAGSSQELDVKQVVSRIQLGQADAGIVYTTDVKAAAGKIAGVPVPESANVVATYPAGAVTHGPNPAGGKAFLGFLTSAQGQAVLARHGFLTP